MSRANKQLIGSMKGLHRLSTRESRREAERAEKKLKKYKRQHNVDKLRG